MANHTRSKVLSAPRLLVADNSTGNLASVQEVPYTSVNASTTVATTSFAGFAEAGTTIQVQPRIMDDNHLQLQFNVSLNSFTGSGSNGVPPPRQTDQISSKVTVPDGYTVIVGGLTNRNNSSSQNGIPWVELVPILKDLTSLQTKSRFTQTTLFVFLRPVIMRDDKIPGDLKYLSDRDIHCAQEPPNYPAELPNPGSLTETPCRWTILQSAICQVPTDDGCRTAARSCITFGRRSVAGRPGPL